MHCSCCLSVASATATFKAIFQWFRNVWKLVFNSGFSIVRVARQQSFCIECTKRDRTVLFITRQSADILPLLSQLEDGVKERLKRFIIMYIECIEDVTEKLVELHNWVLVPDLVVLDLYGFIVGYNAHSVQGVSVQLFPSPVSALQSLCHCVATLFNYMNSVERRILKLKSVAEESSGAPLAYSIVLLESHRDVLTQTQLELIINLYFYDAAAYDDFNELTNKIFATCR